MNRAVAGFPSSVPSLLGTSDRVSPWALTLGRRFFVSPFYMVSMVPRVVYGQVVYIYIYIDTMYLLSSTRLYQYQLDSHQMLRPTSYLLKRFDYEFVNAESTTVNNCQDKSKSLYHQPSTTMHGDLRWFEASILCPFGRVSMEVLENSRKKRINKS